MISDVFFDLDHTLWDFEKNSALAIDTVFKKHGIDINLDHFLEYYVPMNLKYWELYRKEIITQTQMRYSRLKETFDLLDYEIDDETIVFLSQEYIFYLPQFNHLFDGVIEILDYLKPKYNLHIITNGFHEIQSKKMTNSSITHYFKTITNSEMVGVKKPNPLIFEYALHNANAKKENSIMIGDCIEADVQGALDFGMDAILFSDKKDPSAYKYRDERAKQNINIKQITHLLELKKYL